MNELADLKVFVEVATRLSFTAAADHLGINKSAVSKAVSRIEERLGVKLIQRSTRKLTLTAEGARLHEKSSSAFQYIAEAEQEITSNQQQIKGRLRVVAPMSFGLTTLAHHLPDFLAQHPKLTLELHLEDRFSEIIGEGFDVAIRIAKMKDSTLVARKLGEIDHVTVASPSYLELHGTPSHPEDLSSHRCLIYTYRSTPWDWEYQDASGAAVSARVQGSFESNNSLVIRECLIRGMGVALIPSFVVKEDIASGRLKEVMKDYAGFRREVFAVIPNRKHVTARTRVFIEFMRAVMEQESEATSLGK